VWDVMTDQEAVDFVIQQVRALTQHAEGDASA
jgi:hypothetical protein